jgi:hypothetical protein
MKDQFKFPNLEFGFKIPNPSGRARRMLNTNTE